MEIKSAVVDEGDISKSIINELGKNDTRELVEEEAVPKWLKKNYPGVSFRLSEIEEIEEQINKVLKPKRKKKAGRSEQDENEIDTILIGGDETKTENGYKSYEGLKEMFNDLTMTPIEIAKAIMNGLNVIETKYGFKRLQGIADMVENYRNEMSTTKKTDQTVKVTKTVEWLDKNDKKHTKTKETVTVVPDGKAEPVKTADESTEQLQVANDYVNKDDTMEYNTYVEPARTMELQATIDVNLKADKIFRVVKGRVVLGHFADHQKAIACRNRANAKPVSNWNKFREAVRNKVAAKRLSDEERLKRILDKDDRRKERESKNKYEQEYKEWYRHWKDDEEMGGWTGMELEKITDKVDEGVLKEVVMEILKRQEKLSWISVDGWDVEEKYLEKIKEKGNPDKYNDYVIPGQTKLDLKAKKQAAEVATRSVGDKLKAKRILEKYNVEYAETGNRLTWELADSHVREELDQAGIKVHSGITKQAQKVYVVFDRADVKQAQELAKQLEAQGHEVANKDVMDAISSEDLVKQADGLDFKVGDKVEWIAETENPDMDYKVVPVGTQGTVTRVEGNEIEVEYGKEMNIVFTHGREIDYLKKIEAGKESDVATLGLISSSDVGENDLHNAMKEKLRLKRERAKARGGDWDKEQAESERLNKEYEDEQKSKKAEDKFPGQEKAVSLGFVPGFYTNPKRAGTTYTIDYVGGQFEGSFTDPDTGKKHIVKSDDAQHLVNIAKDDGFQKIVFTDEAKANNKKAAKEETKEDMKETSRKIEVSKEIPGGMAEKKKLTEKDVDPKQLAKGIEIEMEHTDDKKVATEIALDHLSENPKYYLPYLEDAEQKADKDKVLDKPFVKEYNKKQEERLNNKGK